MTKLFLESLDRSRREVFKKLKVFRGMGVLGGGTAIALQIGHRRSFDFDIFTPKSLEPNFWRKIKEVFGQNCRKSLDTPDQINLVTSENIAITFFYDDCPLKFPPVNHEYLGLLDLRDLASNKARTIGQRGKWRDYVDLYFLLRENKVSLAEVIKISQERCGGEFSPRLFLQQLSYFGDITDYKIDYIGPEINQDDIKEFLISEASTILESHSP